MLLFSSKVKLTIVFLLHIHDSMRLCFLAGFTVIVVIVVIVAVRSSGSNHSLVLRFFDDNYAAIVIVTIFAMIVAFFARDDERFQIERAEFGSLSHLMIVVVRVHANWWRSFSHLNWIQAKRCLRMLVRLDELENI